MYDVLSGGDLHTFYRNFEGSFCLREILSNGTGHRYRLLQGQLKFIGESVYVDIRAAVPATTEYNYKKLAWQDMGEDMSYFRLPEGNT